MEPRSPRRPATYEDLKTVPAHLVAEIIDGELLALPRPSAPHAYVASTLGADLIAPFDRGRGGPGGWAILFKPELHLGQDVLVPDLAAWRRERMPQVPDEPALTLVPDWVCEVLSPSTERVDRIRKTRLYARAGVRHVWLINPLQQTLEVLRLEGDHYGLVIGFAAEERARAEPSEAIELELALLWKR